MAVRIRLQRFGSAHHSFYRIVACDSKRARNGKFLALLGTYDPDKDLLKADLNEVNRWYQNGALPTDTIKSLFKKKKLEISKTFKVQPKEVKVKEEPKKEVKPAAKKTASKTTKVEKEIKKVEPTKETAKKAAPKKTPAKDAKDATKAKTTMAKPAKDATKAKTTEAKPKTTKETKPAVKKTAPKAAK